MIQRRANAANQFFANLKKLHAQGIKSCEIFLFFHQLTESDPCIVIIDNTDGLMTLIGVSMKESNFWFSGRLKEAGDFLNQFVTTGLGLTVNRTHCVGTFFSNMLAKQECSILDKYLMLIAFMFELVLSRTLELCFLECKQKSEKHQLSSTEALLNCTKDIKCSSKTTSQKLCAMICTELMMFSLDNCMSDLRTFIE